MDNQTNLGDLGFSKALYRGGSLQATGQFSLYSNSDSGTLDTAVADGSASTSTLPGDFSNVMFAGKTSFKDTAAGYMMGMDLDGTYKWTMGSATSSIDYNVTAADTVTVTGIGIVSPTISFGKTSFSDSTHAGYYISSAGVYVGAAADATKMKYTVADGTFDLVGTISSRSTATIAGAINVSGNLITDVINARLDSSARTILAGFTFGATDYSGAVNAGTVTWNTTTGAVTGGSGVVLYRAGIVGVNTGVVTFSIDATTGAATFAGALSAPTGNLGGFTLGADYIRDAADSMGLASTVTVGDDVRFWAGATFANRATAPFFVTESGAVTATNLTLTGGTVSYGKTSFSDSTNAGYYISALGIYVGAAADASKLKYTVADGTFDFVGTISSRSTVTIASAIDVSGNLLTDITNARLNTFAQTMLAGFTFGVADYAGALNAGTITWNTTTGALTGGSGVLVYRGGIIGAAAGVATFTIDAATGAATFAGALSAPTGNIGGFTIGASSLSVVSGGNTVIVSSGVTAFTAGPTGTPTFTVSQAGALVATSATITGAITASSGSITGGFSVLAALSVGTAGSLGSGQTAYDTGTGFWLEYNAGTPRFSLGNSAGNKMTWNGSVLSITGTLTATSGTIGGWTISANALTSGSVSINSSTEQILFGAASSPTVGTGIFLGKSTLYQFRVGDPAGNQLLWNGTTLDMVGTISLRSTATIASTINVSGNVVTDLINARIDTSAKTMLAGFTFGVADYAGALNSGTITWNTTTGALTGGSGVLVYRGGIIGAAAGVATFTIDSATGTATFAGTLSAPTGNIGAWTINSTSLTSTGVTLSATGDAYIAFGVTPPTSPTLGTGIFINKTGLFGLNANTQNFKISATDGSITAILGTIGGLTLSSSALTATAGGNTTIVSSGATAFTAGATGSPTFTVTQAGAMTSTSGAIAAFTIAGTTLSATNLVLTSGAANVANIAVGTGANLAGLNAGNAGTDIAFWAGATYVNRATAPTTVNLQGDLTATSATIAGNVTAKVTFTAGEAIEAGDLVGLTSASTVKRYAPTALPDGSGGFEFTSILADTLVFSTAHAGKMVNLSSALRCFVTTINKNATGVAGTIITIPITSSTGAVGSLHSYARTDVLTPSNVDAVKMDSTRILLSMCTTNSFKTIVHSVDPSTGVATPGGIITVDSTTVSEGFCDYVSDSHVLYVSMDTTTKNIQFYKYTVASTTLTSSSSGTVTTGLNTHTFVLKGFRKWGTTNYFLFVVQDTTDATGKVFIAHYDTGTSAWDVVGTITNMPSSQQFSATSSHTAVFADVSDTQMVVAVPTSATDGKYFLVYRSSASSTTPLFGTVNSMPTMSSYVLSVVNARCAFLTTQNGATATATLLEVTTTETDIATRATRTYTTFASGNTLQNPGITSAFSVSPVRMGLVAIDSSSDADAGTSSYSLPVPVGIATATVAAASPSTAIISGSASGIVTPLTSASKYYADIGGILTTDTNGSPDKIGVSDTTSSIVVKSW